MHRKREVSVNPTAVKACSVNHIDAVVDRILEDETRENGESDKRERILRLLEEDGAAAEVGIEPSFTRKLKTMNGDAFPDIMIKMICQNCHRMPSPYKRYVCPAGHILCYDCGKERSVKHANSCLIEIKTNEGRSPGPVASTSTTALASLKYTNDFHFPVCQNKIEERGADPFSAAFYLKSTWKCPLDGGRCQAQVKGEEMFAHVAECHAEETENKCIMMGCDAVIPIQEMVNHLIFTHKIDATNFEGGESHTRGEAGKLYIPQSVIEGNKPFFTVIRFRSRFFLFCLEPSTLDQHEVGMWIRRISNKSNREEEDQPYFHYNLTLTNKFSNLQMFYHNACVDWRKSSSSVLKDEECLQLPNSMLLKQFVLQYTDKTEDATDAGSGKDTVDDDEPGALPVVFRISEENEVGPFYRTNGLQHTSSMESVVSPLDTSFVDEEDNWEEEGGYLSPAQPTFASHGTIRKLAELSVSSISSNEDDDDLANYV